MASVFNREGSWVVKWQDGTGRWRQRRTACETKAQAKGLARDLERQAERQRQGLEALPKVCRLTFGELLDWYAENFGTHLRSRGDRISAELHLRPVLGSLPLKEVTSARIDEALAAGVRASGKPLAPKTLNNLRAFVQSVFTRAIQRGLWDGANPANAVPRRNVPKRVPSYLKPSEVTQVLAHVPVQWRPLFACAVYTGMRRGELVALRKSDVDLPGGTLTVARSWDSDTTKGRRAALLPIHPELRPYLADAMRRSPSELVFPRPDGSMHTEHIDLPKILRSALNRAGLAEGWLLKCRRCRHHERSAVADTRPCPKCGFAFWPSAMPRRVRFHDLRHTTATLLLKAGASLAVVQRILRHSSPTITAEVYGHLDLADMGAALNRLSFAPKPEASAAVLPIAVNERRGAPVVRNGKTADSDAPSASAFPQSFPPSDYSGPSRIRTWDQSVMSPDRASWQGVAGGHLGALPTGNIEGAPRGDWHGVAPEGTATSPHGAPVVRNFAVLGEPLLTAAQVAKRLNVCRATVYSLCERGELQHVRIANAIRVAPADLAAFIERKRGIKTP